MLFVLGDDSFCLVRMDSGIPLVLQGKGGFAQVSFREPLHSLITQVRVEDPLSHVFFSEAACERASKEFYRETLVWGSLLHFSTKD